MYVDRKVSVNSISAPPAVDPIKPAKNDTTFSKDTYLLYSEAFYEKLRDLKKHYKRFYLNQQQLEDTLDSFKENEDYDSINQLTQLLRDLVDKYNHAYESLKKLESHLNTLEYSNQIKETLLKYQDSLKNIGVTMDEFFHLHFNSVDINLQSDILFLFDYENGLIRKLFNIFRSIKLSRATKNKTYDIDSHGTFSIAGMLLDKRL